MRIIASAAGLSAKLTERLIERFFSLHPLRIVSVLFPFTQVSSRVCDCGANLQMSEVSMRRYHALIVLSINIQKNKNGYIYIHQYLYPFLFSYKYNKQFVINVIIKLYKKIYISAFFILFFIFIRSFNILRVSFIICTVDSL